MIKYYPSFRVRTNLSTNGSEFLLNGVPYTGKYYLTFEGDAFTGANPVFGKNEPLQKYVSSPAFIENPKGRVPSSVTSQIDKSVKSTKTLSSPIPYYPYPILEDYQRGYIMRYFVKRINDKGYVTEISPEEYVDINNGSARYDVSLYQTAEIMWKLTGPLHKIRLSQYDTRAGIVDTNERLVLEEEKTFVGIKDFIGGEYDKFARPTK